MQAEEQVLFPVFERVTGMAPGPVSVMTREHAMLREISKSIGDALARGDVQAAESGVVSAADVLELHDMKEERVIYPQTDRALSSAAERDALVLRMQGV
jgi:hemerythrin-like domain-containing protein